MKKFNESVEFSLSADFVAQMMLDVMAPDAKHRELIVETLIGRMLSNDKSALGLLATSLFGIKREMNFVVGEEVVYNETYYDRQLKENRNCGKATIMEIQEYSDMPILVRYKRNVINESGDSVEKETNSWTTLDKVTKIPIQ